MTDGLLVASLGHQGEGRLEDGRFVPRVLPGERVEIVEDGTARVLLPSADRVAAPCRHYKSCGGCALQHASDTFVAEWKHSVVKTALSARGLEAVFAPVETSPSSSRRRAKFSGRRTKKGAIVGLHGRASDTIHAVPECQLMTAAILAVMPWLEKITVTIASRRGELGFTVIDTASGIDLAVEAGDSKPEDFELLAEIAREADLARLSLNGEVIVLRRPPEVLFDGVSVAPPAGSFLQATAHGETALRDTVHQVIGSARKVIDLFSGCGTFALPLARGAEIHAVESEQDMLDALMAAWRKAEALKRVTVEKRDLFRRPVRRDELNAYDAAVIDPPRAGAEAQIAEIAASDLAVVAMVSCNPVTFARDAEMLIRAGFKLGEVQVVDQFRWSSHVEIAAGFTR